MCVDKKQIIGNTLYIKCWLIDHANPNHKILHSHQRKRDLFFNNKNPLIYVKRAWSIFEHMNCLGTSVSGSPPRSLLGWTRGGGVECTEASVSKATALKLPSLPPEDAMETGSEFWFCLLREREKNSNSKSQSIQSTKGAGQKEGGN